MNEYENREICSKCGGYCCKKSGCDYFVEDFESLSLDYLQSRLNEGRISIVSLLNFERIFNGKLICTPLLYLRARNRGREVVDLLSMKTTCMSLTENGCVYSFSERPSGGKHLIPDEKYNCMSDVDMLSKIREWESYQKVLSRLVKRITGKSVNAKLKEDVFNLMYNMFCENYQDVMEAEIEDLKGMAPLLHEAFKEEVSNAYNAYKSRNNKVLIRKQYK